jgi:hypothetical protein
MSITVAKKGDGLQLQNLLRVCPVQLTMLGINTHEKVQKYVEQNGENLFGLNLRGISGLTNEHISGYLQSCSNIKQLVIEGYHVNDEIVPVLVVHARSLEKLTLRNCRHVSNASQRQLLDQIPGLKIKFRKNLTEPIIILDDMQFISE